VNIIPVPQGIQPGPQAAQWIYDQITTHPETHNQHHWECGTTRCVAGWAAYLFPQELYIRSVPDEIDPWEKTLAYVTAGMHVLGIGEDEARRLFSTDISGDKVCAALKEIANGDPVSLPPLDESDYEILPARQALRDKITGYMHTPVSW
jgi:hypothetical protein